MEDFILEDYRHPWETGNHWELKRRFMEKYKDTYPVDRLLCLAQAYSNIELLHCSYPAEVMKEIYELSKPLKVVSQSNKTLNPMSQKKSTASDPDSGQRTKFLKLGSSVHVSEAWDTTIGNKQTSKHDSEVYDPRMKQASVNSAVQRDIDMQHNQEDSDLADSSEDALDFRDSGSTGPVGQKKYILSKSNNPNESSFQSLNRLSAASKTYSVIRDDVQNISNLIQNLEKFIHLFATKAIARAAQASHINQHIVYNVIVNEHTNVKSKIFLCELCYKNIMLSSGTGRSKRKARESAGLAAVEKLRHLKNFVIEECDGSLPSPTDDSGKNHAGPSGVSPEFEINQDLLDSSIEKQFVIMDNSDMVTYAHRSAAALLLHSAGATGKAFTWEHSQWQLNDGSLRAGHKFDVIFEGKIIGSGMSHHKKEAKHLASSNALAHMKKTVYTIKFKDVHTEDIVIRRHELMSPGFNPGTLFQSNAIMADKANAYCQGSRFDAGSNFNVLVRKISVLLEDFKLSNSFKDLIFASDFSKEERKEIFKRANQLDLSCNSCGFEGVQQIFVKRKFSPLQLLDHLIQVGGSTSKYDLLDLSKE